MSLTILTLDEIKKCITMEQAINTMENAFKQLANKQAVFPLRTPLSINKENALFLTMPAYLIEQEALGLKVVSVFPSNPSINKPTINGAILLLDAQTGEIAAIMEAAYLTALRTGAVSGLATKYLTKKNAHHVAIIGAGIQAITQLEAVATVRDIKQVSIWSRNKERADAFANTISDHFEVQVYDDIQSAVKKADIICTATGSTRPLIHLKDIKPTVHINAIGSHTREMCEIANDVMAKASIVVDQLDAVLAEAGEVISAIENKKLKLTSIRELGNLITTNQRGYKGKMTVFKSVGLAIQDISIAQEVYRNAQEKRLGKNIEL